MTPYGDSTTSFPPWFSYRVTAAAAEDSSARVDLNVVATATGAIVEVQGTAEGEAVPRSDIDRMIDLALEGIQTLTEIQARALGIARVSLDGIVKARS